MVKRKERTQRRVEALSREQIINAAVDLLDEHGEAGLTFRTLAERLATGPGSIYWHIANKSELLNAACDALIARTLEQTPAIAPEDEIRAVALSLFDMIDERPWLGSALTGAAVGSPVVRILERIGQQLGKLGVPESQHWKTVSTLVAYILGVSKQNAANGEFARSNGLDRSDFLGSMASIWSELDAEEYPFARRMAGSLEDHDDRADFLAGIDLILRGIGSLPLSQRPAHAKRKSAGQKLAASAKRSPSKRDAKL